MLLIKRLAISIVSVVYLICNISHLAIAADAQGYISTTNPTDDRVALLIEIGKLRASLDAYNASASLFTASPSPYNPGLSEAEISEWQSILTSSVNQKTIDAYIAIAPLIKAPQGAEIIPRLTRLVSSESITMATDNSRNNQDAKRIEYETARGVEDRLDMINDEIFPTRKEYFLVASALLRLGGQHSEQAVNNNGEVVDLYQLLMARAYNWIADKSHPRWISYCKGQSEPHAKLDEGLDHIDAKSATNKKGMQIEVTADDFYKLASATQIVSEGLPDTDEKICK